MASCKRCSAELTSVMKFCATCGAPAAGAPDAAPKSVVDPFAQTAKKKDSEGAIASAAPSLPASAASGPDTSAPVSPLAFSNIFPAAAPVGPAVAPSPKIVSMPTPPMTQPLPSRPAPAATPAPTPAAYGPASFAPTAAQPAVAPFVPTMRVLVLWSDGQRYPGVVSHVNDRMCLVSFGDGQQRWVDMQYLSRA